MDLHAWPGEKKGKGGGGWNSFGKEGGVGVKKKGGGVATTVSGKHCIVRGETTSCKTGKKKSEREGREGQLPHGPLDLRKKGKKEGKTTNPTGPLHTKGGAQFRL